jgi:type VI secretion system protein ImpA
MTARFLDLDELLAPVPGDDPAGDPGTYLAVRSEFEQARKEIDPSQYDEADKMRPKEYRPADWPKIVRDGSKLLAEKSKDLRIACWVAEAITRREGDRWPQQVGQPTTGFAGLADGLALLRRMVEEAWDRVLPPLDPDDLDYRAGPFNWLAEAKAGAWFPATIRGLPLLSGADGTVCYRDWFSDKEDVKARCGKVFAAASRVQCKSVFDDLDRAVTELQGLYAALKEKMGPAAPGLIDLRSAVADCHKLAESFVQEKGEPAAEAGDDVTASDPTGGTPTAGPSGSGGPGSVGQAVASRDGAYRMLQQAADLLEKLEPHSPIPYLVRRAVALKDKKFHELVRAFLRDTSIEPLERELGIEETGAG